MPTRSVASAPHAAISDALIRARVGNHLDRLAALGYTGAVLVLRDGKPVVERAWGFADRDKGIRADTRSTWNLGSVTKQFTAAAILRLEEQGKLRTTDSITRWFPDAEGPKRAITIHQLLTHTAGFESDYAPGDYAPNTRAEYMARMLAAPLQSPPGTEHSYANSGYSMLAAIIELVTGKEYETALTELVLAPAGMTETGYLRPDWAPERITHGYQDGRDWGTIVDRLKVPGAPFWALRGNGGLQTTLADMTRWERALTTNAVLTARSRRKFMTGYVSEGGSGRFHVRLRLGRPSERAGDARGRAQRRQRHLRGGIPPSRRRRDHDLRHLERRRAQGVARHRRGRGARLRRRGGAAAGGGGDRREDARGVRGPVAHVGRRAARRRGTGRAPARSRRRTLLVAAAQGRGHRAVAARKRAGRADARHLAGGLPRRREAALRRARGKRAARPAHRPGEAPRRRSRRTPRRARRMSRSSVPCGGIVASSSARCVSTTSARSFRT